MKEVITTELTLAQKKEIDSQFLPKKIEREALSKVYETLLNGELTPELSAKAKVFLKSLVSYRTGVAAIHKTQKAYFLAGGRYVDSWKNKETELTEQMEEKCGSLANHFINLERERLKKIVDDRRALLEPYITEESIMPENLGGMDDTQFALTLKNFKKLHEIFEKEKEQADIGNKRMALLKKLAHVESDDDSIWIDSKVEDEDGEVIRTSKLTTLSLKAFEAQYEAFRKISEGNDAIIDKALRAQKREASIISTFSSAPKRGAEKPLMESWVEKAFVCKTRMEGLSKEAQAVEEEIFSKFEAFKKWAAKTIQSNERIK